MNILKWLAIFAIALLGITAPGLALAAGTNAAGLPSYDGAWWDPSKDGEGLAIMHQNGIVFILFFGYDAQNNPTFFQFSGHLQKNAQGQDTLTAPTAVTNGPQPTGFNPSTRVTVRVTGSASITFTDTYNATMTYGYQDPTGGPFQTGTLNLTQLQFGCAEPAKWNNAYCVIPQGIKSGNPKAVPAGCMDWRDICWQNSIKNGTVQLIETSARMTGLSGYDGRPIMFAFFIDATGYYRNTVLYGDTGEPVGGNPTLINGVASSIDWTKGNSDGILQHTADGACWQMRWFPPTGSPGAVPGYSNVWANVSAPCQ